MHPDGESLDILIWHLGGFMEADTMDSCVQHRHCQALDPGHHQLLCEEVLDVTLGEGKFLQGVTRVSNKTKNVEVGI